MLAKRIFRGALSRMNPLPQYRLNPRKWTDSQPLHHSQASFYNFYGEFLSLAIREGADRAMLMQVFIMVCKSAGMPGESSLAIDSMTLSAKKGLDRF